METDEIFFEELKKVQELYFTCKLQKTKNVCKELENYILKLIQSKEKEVYHAKTS